MLSPPRRGVNPLTGGGERLRVLASPFQADDAQIGAGLCLAGGSNRGFGFVVHTKVRPVLITALTLGAAKETGQRPREWFTYGPKPVIPVQVYMRQSTEDIWTAVTREIALEPATPTRVAFPEPVKIHSESRCAFFVWGSSAGGAVLFKTGTFRTLKDDFLTVPSGVAVDARYPFSDRIPRGLCAGFVRDVGPPLFGDAVAGPLASICHEGLLEPIPAVINRTPTKAGDSLLPPGDPATLAGSIEYVVPQCAREDCDVAATDSTLCERHLGEARLIAAQDRAVARQRVKGWKRYEVRQKQDKEQALAEALRRHNIAHALREATLTGVLAGAIQVLASMPWRQCAAVWRLKIDAKEMDPAELPRTHAQRGFAFARVRSFSQGQGSGQARGSRRRSHSEHTPRPPPTTAGAIPRELRSREAHWRQASRPGDAPPRHSLELLDPPEQWGHFFQFQGRLFKFGRETHLSQAAHSNGRETIEMLETLPSTWFLAIGEPLPLLPTDVVCLACSGAAERHPRTVERDASCCVRQCIERSSRRIGPHLLCGTCPVAKRLAEFKPGAVADGVAALAAYGHNNVDEDGIQRRASLHHAIRSMMRLLGVRRSDLSLERDLRQTEHDIGLRQLRLLTPIVKHIHFILSALQIATPSCTVFRSVTAYVAPAFKLRAYFVWQETQSALLSAEKCMAPIRATRGAGPATLFIIAQRSGADCSLFTGSADRAELVWKTNRVFRVCGQLHPRLRLSLGMMRDVVSLEEIRGDRATKSQHVDLCIEAVQRSAFMYDDLMQRYVEPEVKDGSGVVGGLFAGFEKFLMSAQRVLILSGPSGSGKTSAALALSAHLLRAGAGTDRPVPIFTPLYDAGPQLLGSGSLGGTIGTAGLTSTTEQAQSEASPRGPPDRPTSPDKPVVQLVVPGGAAAAATEQDRPASADTMVFSDAGSLSPQMIVGRGRRPSTAATGEPIVEAVAASLNLDPQHVPALKDRLIVVFLDHLEEAHLPTEEGVLAATLRRKPLLERGGIHLSQWPKAKFVVTASSEFLSGHGLEPGHFTKPRRVSELTLQRLRQEQRRAVIRRAADQETNILCRRLREPRRTVSSAVALMRCYPPPIELATAVSASTPQSTEEQDAMRVCADNIAAATTARAPRTQNRERESTTQKKREKKSSRTLEPPCPGCSASRGLKWLSWGLVVGRGRGWRVHTVAQLKKGKKKKAHAHARARRAAACHRRCRLGAALEQLPAVDVHSGVP
eukprot:TRINITY_DN4493_c1_g1_i3.p1 TRINITY_DN4493_c1_g1~~TRINITY_DN4493_c1_g1_i3.p1  ORF type:complete len:1238 (+),score=222.38 TRINITY_DN4493_c1_g1_i3:62-3775(+)